MTNFISRLLVLGLTVSLLSSAAWAAGSIRIGGKSIKRIVALEKGPSDQLELASSETRYSAEIERSAQIRAGYFASIENSAQSYGLLYNQGFSVKAKRLVDDVNELDEFESESLEATMHFANLSFIKIGDEYTYTVDGTAIFSPNVGPVGLWLTLQGIWSLSVKREGNQHYILTISLKKAKDGSLNVSKGWVHGGVGLRTSLADGMIFDVHDSLDQLQVVAKSFLKGDLRPLQKLSQSNGRYKLLEKNQDKEKGRYAYIAASSPYVTWLNWGFTTSFTENESKALSSNDKILKDEKSVTYQKENNLQFFNYLTSSSRNFSATSNLNDGEKDGVDLAVEHWEREWSSTNSRALKMEISRMIGLSRLDKELEIDIPDNTDIGYARVHLVLNYSPAQFQYLKNNLSLVDQMKLNAIEQLEKDTRLKMEELSRYPGSAATLYNGIMMARLAEMNYINFAWGQLKKYLKKEELDLESHAYIMRAIYMSPRFYKEWYKLTRRCGLDFKFTIESESFKSFERTIHFNRQASCR